MKKLLVCSLTLLALFAVSFYWLTGSAASPRGAPAPAVQQPAPAVQPVSLGEAEQMLFLIDNSGSMTSPVNDPENPGLSRWQLVQHLAPRWMAMIKPEVLVGAVSVGGSCESPPAFRFPVGADRTQVLSAVSAAAPEGGTPLNRILKLTPSLFNLSLKGKKRILLFSDGLNSCAPGESTCEIVRALRNDYGITIDVVAWVTEPAMVSEFQCIVDAGGGSFVMPQTMNEWINIPALTLDPWPYVVLALGLVGLFFASIILYRHAYHVFKWGSSTASLAAGLLLTAGTLVLYLVLFARTGWLAALLGLAVIGAMTALAQKRTRPAPAAPLSAPWAALAVALLCLVGNAPAQNVENEVCGKKAQGAARHHHILALDVSGTVMRKFDEMKALLACYAAMYTLPGEEITLVAFGEDERGSVRELRTFTVPASGSTEILNGILDDLRIQNPRQTKTYFKPLADFLGQKLQDVYLQPVVLVLSDGISDGFADETSGLVSFHEIPFESFGTRGIYALPGVTGWKVAVQGTTGLDLSALFKQPLAQYNPRSRTPQPLRSVIDPCLVDPPLIFETGEVIQLEPALNPIDDKYAGAILLRVRNECVSRFRSFRVEMRRGDEVQVIGVVSNMLINTQPTELRLDVSTKGGAAGEAEAIIQLVLDQSGTERTIYASKPSRVTLRKASYLGAHGLLLGGLLLALGVGLAIPIRAVRYRRAREQNRPEIVKVPGGSAVALARNQRAQLGGAGCELQVPGLPAGLVLASVQATEQKGRLIVQPADGFRMRVNGFDAIGSSEYALGSSLQFSNPIDGHVFDVPLYAGAGHDLGFGAGATSMDKTDFPSFPGFGGTGGTGFNASGTGTDSYI